MIKDIVPKRDYSNIVLSNIEKPYFKINPIDKQAIAEYIESFVEKESFITDIISPVRRILFRLLIKAGTLINFSNSGFYSKVIKFATDSHWSHSGIILRVDGDMIYTAESLNEGFIQQKYTFEHLYSRYLKGNIALGFFKKPLSNSRKEFIEFEIRQLLSRKYGWWSIFWIASRIIANKIKIKSYADMPELSDGEKTLICSEAAARLVDSIGNIDLSKEFEIEFDSIYPGLLMESKHISWLFRERL
ncbi:MAG: hypothetical protein OMM_00961 [Candidatus Magnetoglobus multicellularis str. Araruama]|uniref:Uncharacterized protein n=1 Tax=Candidatus Magnetoglobus multicellularis str. Araruama TaxID=890399 RepID=A0A1V1PEU8_9BACT|nr:MAG: hypothetical protein OMM_00961 [Candidatus Magnetoglobus multicellularis str. Araruama]